MEDLQLHFVLVDDHSMVQEGFRSVISNTFKNANFSLFSSVDEAIQSQEIHAQSIVITDIDLGRGKTGFDLIEHLKEEEVGCTVIVLSMYEQAVYLQRVKALFVDAYINKREAANMMVEAIKSVVNGKRFFSGDIHKKMSRIEDELHIYQNLYPKEREVFMKLALGLSVKKIASDLDVSVKTIHSHRLNLYYKFGFSSSFEFTKYAIRNGIINQDDLN